LKVLAFDSSAISCSVCLLEDEKVLGEFFVNSRLKHSETLLIMTESLLKQTGIDLKEIDFLAVSAGPGSFTGLRIAISIVKGIGIVIKKPCVAVSSLSSMVYNLQDLKNCIICCVMDARCNQVYNAVFDKNLDIITRKTEDRIIFIDDLLKELLNEKKSIYLVGDGANLCYNKIKDNFKNIYLVSENLKYQHAYGVAQAGKVLYKSNEILNARDLKPVYIRIPQAERELKNKNLSR